MAALYPLTLDAWNSILSRINSLASWPPEGCDPVAQLPLVTAPHKWSVHDITAAQNKLREICPDNTFTTPVPGVPGGKWRRLYLNELATAIDNGWCNCEPQIPCCIPNGQGTIWINGPGGGYWVTVPYWQVIEQFLFGNIDYSQAEAALPEGIMARIVECYPGSNVFISHSLHHDHWINCIYRDYWIDGGSPRGEEYWSTCGIDPTEITYLGRLPAIASSYHGGTSVGSNTYYDQPMFTQYRYDYIEERWYEERWIGYFEVDSYSYYFDLWSFRCPS